MGVLEWPTDGRHALLGGEWVELPGVEQIDSVSPSAEHVTGQIPRGRPEDVELAVKRITPALEGWAATPATRRAEYLIAFSQAIADHADELIELEIEDSGLTRRTARRDVAEVAVTWPRFYANFAPTLTGETFSTGPALHAFTTREPFGIVGRIIPFNHPIFFASQAASVALIAGNAVLLKPPEVCSLSTLAFAEIARSIFPPGVFNVLTGYGHEVGAAIASHPQIPRIGFTGSVATGRRILEGAVHNIKSVTLELGGKNPLIVLPDADIAEAADAAVLGMTFNQAGQSCQSTSRLYIHESIHDRVVDAVIERLAALKIEDPHSESSDVGPLAFKAHFERVLGFIDSGLSEGAKLAFGGHRPEHLDKGYFIEPTLFTDVTASMRIAREEIFGPVLCAFRWNDLDAVIAAANDTEYGLVSRVVAGSMEEGLQVARRIQSGTAYVNHLGMRPQGMSYVGFKHSGLGEQDCLAEVLSFTQEKSYLVGVRTTG